MLEEAVAVLDLGSGFHRHGLHCVVSLVDDDEISVANEAQEAIALLVVGGKHACPGDSGAFVEQLMRTNYL